MKLQVSLGDVVVGTLERTEDLRTSFRFDEGYVALARRPVLGQYFVDKLRRPLPSESQLPAFFANLLPEGRLRTLIASAIEAREHQEFRLLAHLGDDLPGAVRVREAGQDAAARAPEAIPGPRRELGSRLRFSLAGVQLKFSMLQTEKQLVLPTRGNGGNWLLKLPDASFPGLPDNEYFMMSWARACGIDVPEFNIFTYADTDGIDRQFFPDGSVAFGVRRFDRPTLDQRVHIEDFAQVNGIHPLNKYDDEPEPRALEGRLNYETLALQILRLCGEEDLRQFVRRLVFMVLSGNADAHLKNWSLIYPDGRRPRLSPAYDQVATVAYPGYGDQLALPFASSLEFEDVSLDGFRGLGRSLNLDPEVLAQQVREDITRIMDCRHTALVGFPIEMRYHLDEHHARLRRAFGSLLHTVQVRSGGAL